MALNLFFCKQLNKTICKRIINWDRVSSTYKRLGQCDRYMYDLDSENLTKSQSVGEHAIYY
jgi:hypothetical protein